MNRKAFLLGFYSIGGQVLLLRELVASFYGDELFIGTALFGWLIAVAFGAYFWGRKKTTSNATGLFVIGVILLPLSMVAVRLSPLAIGYDIGEIIPFTTAALISIILTLPVGFISGALFPAISSEGYRPSKTINRVYLMEGIGAFIGGITVTALVGSLFSNLAMAVGLSVIVLICSFIPLKGVRVIIWGASALIILMAAKYILPGLDGWLDGVKYPEYNIDYAFDTHYGHQTIISRDSAISLVTDNSIELTYPDLMTAENSIIPPLLYSYNPENILIIGRTEFGVMQIAETMPDIRITALDARSKVSRHLDEVIPNTGGIVRIEDDPISYLSNSAIFTKYDIIIVNAGDPDCHKNGRLYTGRFLGMLKRLIKPGGLLYIPTDYDTDRYLSYRKQLILSLIYRTLTGSFKHVYLWPGTSTLYFASDDNLFDIDYDSLAIRINHLPYRTQFISPDYLGDRLEPFKMSRLKASVEVDSSINSVERPRLVHYQALLNSLSNRTDAVITEILFDSLYPALLVPLLLIGIFTFSVRGRQRRRSYGLFLYFTAGLFSLSAELISFYLYQSSAGSLYSEMGILIGTFMLGLALGTYFSIKSDYQYLEYPALLLSIMAIILLFMTGSRIPMNVLLFYHMLFLLTVAIATGALFVAATRRYYFGRSEFNRGTGYSFEIAGSSIGALFVITILLPLIGVKWLLGSILIFMAIAIIGAYITE